MPVLRQTKEEIEYDLKTETKICRVCEQRKSFTNFYRLAANKSDGYCYRCKDCDTDARHEYVKKHPERTKHLTRNRGIKHKYGIDIEEYNRMLEAQGGCCAICLSNKTKGSDSFSIDHCHDTNKVRGLLCNQCNRGLGMLGDSVEALERALNYLRTNS